MKNVMTLGLILLGLVFLLTGCSVQTLDKYSKNSVHLEREFQRVIRRDCNSNVVSDKVETVSSPTAWVEIPPAFPSRVWSSSFRNTTTNSSAGLMSGRWQFQVDYSWGALNMHVQSGANTISYKFYECPEIVPSPGPNQPETCKGQRILEEGNLTIDISYSEKTLSGYSEVVVCDKPVSGT